MIQSNGGYAEGYIDGCVTAKQTHPFTQQDLIEFADYVRQNDLQCNARLELDIKHSKDLFDIWVKERLETINFKD